MRRRIGTFLVLIMIFLTVATPYAEPLLAEPRNTSVGPWIENPSFEGVYAPQDGISQVLVAPGGWRAFWLDRGDNLPLWGVPGGSPSSLLKRPEYKPLEDYVDFRRVRSGDMSQCLFSAWGVLLAGVFAPIHDVEPGTTIRASVYVQSWSSTGHDPGENVGGDMFVTVCIDPSGGTYPWSRRLQCGEWVWAPPAGHGSNGIFAKAYSPPVLVPEGNATIFVIGHGRWAVSHNDLYLEDAGVEVEVVVPPECPPSGECDYGRIEGIVDGVVGGYFAELELVTK